MEWIFQSWAFQLKVKLWFKRHSLRLLTNSSNASCCHGIFRLPYVPNVAISVPHRAHTSPWNAKRGTRRKRSWNVSAAWKDWKSGGFPCSSIQENPNRFLILMPLPSHFHPPFWLHAPSQHLLSFSHFTPPSSTSVCSPQSRLCCLNPSSCATETCGKVAAAELSMMVTRALVLQPCDLLLAVFTEYTRSPQWEESQIEVKSLIGLRLLPGFCMLMLGWCTRWAAVSLVHNGEPLQVQTKVSRWASVSNVKLSSGKSEVNRQTPGCSARWVHWLDQGKKATS